MVLWGIEMLLIRIHCLFLTKSNIYLDLDILKTLFITILVLNNQNTFAGRKFTVVLNMLLLISDVQNTFKCNFTLRIFVCVFSIFLLYVVHT